MASSPESGSPIRVMVVDDHSLVREGTRSVLERDPGIVVVGEADSGESALDIAIALQPDVMLVDIHLPGISGIEVASRLNDEGLTTRILMLTAYPDREYVRAAMAAGAEGYLLKTAPAVELIAAVHAAAEGMPIQSSVNQGPAPRQHHLAPSDPSSVMGQEAVLTPREMEVVGMLAEGLTNKAIAFRMGISRRTVEGHISRVFAKVGASCRTELVRYAIQHDLVEL